MPRPSPAEARVCLPLLASDNVQLPVQKNDSPSSTSDEDHDAASRFNTLNQLLRGIDEAAGDLGSHLEALETAANASHHRHSETTAITLAKLEKLIERRSTIHGNDFGLHSTTNSRRWRTENMNAPAFRISNIRSGQDGAMPVAAANTGKGQDSPCSGPAISPSGPEVEAPCTPPFRAKNKSRFKIKLQDPASATESPNSLKGSKSLSDSDSDSIMPMLPSEGCLDLRKELNAWSAGC